MSLIKICHCFTFGVIFHGNFLFFTGANRGIVVRAVDLKSFASHRPGFESRQGLEFYQCSVSYPASLRNVDGSTQVLVSEIMHGGTPEVFLQKESWNVNM